MLLAKGRPKGIRKKAAACTAFAKEPPPAAQRRAAACPWYCGARSFTLLARGKTNAPLAVNAGTASLCHFDRAQRVEKSLEECRESHCSPLHNTDCIRPSRCGAKARSKACVVLPCLQGVKRTRRNRRHMGACPWQLVAESVGFSAADYSPLFLLGGSFFGSQGLSPCNAYALRRAFALVRLKRNAWLCPCKQAKPSRPFRVT